MPKFHGHDYYLLAIAEHITELNKASLAFPQSLLKHVNNCCLNALDIWNPQSGIVDALPEPIEADFLDFAWAIKLCQDLKKESVESYEKDVIIRHDGSELLEVILSSNPESLCSLDASLGASPLAIRETSCAEKFTPVKSYTENYPTLDEPLSVNDFRLAVEALPPISALLARLQSSDLDDPLLKSDGSKWTEDDFLWIGCECLNPSTDAADVHEVLPLKKEIFNKSILEHDDYSLMPYAFPHIDLVTPPGHIASLSCVETVISMEDCSDTDQSLILEDCESVRAQLILGLSTAGIVHGLDEESTDVNHTSVTSFIAFNNIGFSPLSPVASRENRFQKCMSPFVEHRIVEMGDDGVTGPMRPIPVPHEDLTAEKGLFDKCAIIDEDMKHMERQLWEQEKHFDEVHLPEPIFTQESLPDLVAELSEQLRLSPEDALDHNKVVHWSFDQPDNIGHLPVIASLDNDGCSMQQLCDPESFEKFGTPELSFMSACGDDQSNDDTFREECMQLTENVKPASDSAASKNTQKYVQSLDPLDSFIHVRAKSESIPTTDLQGRSGQQDTHVSTEGNEQDGLVTVKLASNQSSVEERPNMKTVQVVFSGLWEKVLQCIIDGAALHLEIIRQEGLLPIEQELMDISIDMTRFLLKEREKQVSDVALLTTDSHIRPAQRERILQSLTVVHTLRTAADLLVNACLQSCISYLVTNVEDQKLCLGRSCDEVHKQLFQYQCQFLHKSIIHPKLSTLSHQVGVYSTQLPGCQILILVQKGLNSLVPTIQSVLSTIPNLTVSVVHDMKSVNPERATTTTVILSTMMEPWTKRIAEFSLVVLYDERQAPNLKFSCQGKGVSYIGLLSQPFWDTDKNDKTGLPDRMSAITLICSAEMTQYKQLVCLLEAKYNILVIEREYNKLCELDVKIFNADLIVSVTHCVVLLPLQEMKKHWDLALVVKTFVALGLQFSHCFIILHGMDAGNSYVIEKDTLSNIYKLMAALCNLRRTSPLFQTSYKVLVSQRDEDVATSIRSIVDSYLGCSLELDLLRPWLAADASQDEVMLLQMNCMNSFSAQIILSRLTLGEILDKSDTELINLFPEIPERIIKCLHFMISNSQCQQSSLANSSQTCHATGSHTMLTQGSPLPHEGDIVNMDQTQATIVKNGHKWKSTLSHAEKTSYLEEVQKAEQSHCSKVDESPRNVNKYPGDGSNRYGVQLSSGDFSKLEFGSRSASFKQQGCSDSYPTKTANPFLKSLEVAFEHEDHQHFPDSTYKTDHQRTMLHSTQNSPDNLTSVCQNNYSTNTKVNAGIPKRYLELQERHYLQGVIRSNITDLDHRQVYPRPSHFDPSLHNELNCPSSPLKKNYVTRTTHPGRQEDQPEWKSSAHDYDSLVRPSYRSTSDDGQRMMYTNPNFDRQIQTSDFQSYDDNERNILKQPNDPLIYSTSDTNYKIYDNNSRNKGDFHRDYPPLYRSHFETFWNVDARNEESTANDNLPFNVCVSSEHKEDKSLLQSRFISNDKQAEWEVNNGSEAANEHHYSETAGQTLTSGLRNDYSLLSLGSDGYEGRLADIHTYRMENGKHNLMNSTTDSSLRLHKYPTESEHSYVSDADTGERGMSFGIFSCRVQRDADSSYSAAVDSHKDSATNVMADYTKSRSLMYDAPAYTFKDYESLPEESGTDKAHINFDSLPFPVSRELRKHIKRLGDTSQDSNNPGRSFLKGNPNSVRVSRMPDCCHDNNITRHSDNSDQSLVQNQLRPKQVYQQDLHSPVRGLESTTHGVVGQTSNQHPYPAYYKESHSHRDILQFRDSVQPSNLNESDRCHSNTFMHIHQRDLSQSHNTMSPSQHYPSLTSARHVDYCSSPQGLIRSTLGPDRHQKDHLASNHGVTLPDTVRYTQPLNISRMPYTPRHRIAVGLAQPFPRQISSSDPRVDVLTGSPSHDPTRQQQPGNFPAQISTHPESAPMDLVTDEDDAMYRRSEATEFDQLIYEVKRKKWSKHLMSCMSQTRGQPRVGKLNSGNYSRTENPDTTSLSSKRKRKLQLEKKPCNKGQTILVFK